MPESLARQAPDARLSVSAAPPSMLATTLRKALERPADLVGLALIAGFSVAIGLNALVFQTGVHPAPILATPPVTAISAAPPAPSPAMPASDPVVADIQIALALRGYDPGPADGRAGPKTVAAIRAFQASQGLTVDGEPSAALLDAIRASATGHASPTSGTAADPIASLLSDDLASNARLVRKVEQRLADLGYGPLRVDGTVDQQTEKAIRAFEADRSLPVDGVLTQTVIDELVRATGDPIE